MSISETERQSLLKSLRVMGLIGNEQEPVIKPLTGGVSSLIALVTTDAGDVCIKRALKKLKVKADWQAPVERSNAEVAWIRVAQQVVPDAVPELVGHDVEGLTFAMRYLPPQDFPVWKSQLRDKHVRCATASALAKVIVAVHNFSARNPSLRAEFSQDETFEALRLDAYFAESARSNPDCLQAIEVIINATRSNRRVLIHGDVSPKNVLEGRERIVLLDAETATWGDPAFDLAFCLNHLLLKCIWCPQATEQYLACFRVLKDEYLARVEFENPLTIEMRACRLVSALLLARVDGKSPVEYITNDRDRVKVRQFAKTVLMHKNIDQLDTIATAWQRQ